MPPRSVVPKPKQKPHPPLWVACSPPRDDPARRAAWHRRAHVRVHRARGGEGVGGRVLRADRVRRMRAGRLRREPEPRRRAADDAARGRGDRDRARHRRRALLRLLARALLRVRRPPSRHHERLGRVPGQARRVRVRAGDHQRRRRAAGREDPPAGPRARCAARSARPEQVVELVQRYEAVGRGPGDLRAAGGPEQARAHLRVARAVRHEGAAALRRRARGARGREARAAGAGRASARSRGARRRARPIPAT